MRKKVTERRSKEHRFREIEAHLQSAGQGGMRVAGVANAIGKSKSYAHKLLLEMVDLGLIQREVTYTDTDTFFVNYVYYQLALWDNDTLIYCEMDSGISHQDSDALDTYREGDFYAGLEG